MNELQVEMFYHRRKQATFTLFNKDFKIQVHINLKI